MIKSGDHVGSSTDYNDFSFTPLADAIKHEIEGSYTQTPRAYIARRESSTEDRTFGVKFTSMHFTGEESTFYFTITQLKYRIKGTLVIEGLEADSRIKQEGGEYTIRINLTPDDVPMPIGARLKVQYSYLGIPRGAESTIASITSASQYEYEVKLNIIPNGTPDVIGLNFKIYMAEDDSSGYHDITRYTFNYYQNN